MHREIMPTMAAQASVETAKEMKTGGGSSQKQVEIPDRPISTAGKFEKGKAFKTERRHGGEARRITAASARLPWDVH